MTARVEQIRLYRFTRHRQDLRNFVDCQVLQVAQHEHHALSQGKPLRDGPDPVRQVSIYDACVGRPRITNMIGPRRPEISVNRRLLLRSPFKRSYERFTTILYSQVVNLTSGAYS